VEYVTIVMVYAVALLVGAAMMGLPRLLAPRRANPVKAEPFECGKTPFQIPEGRFPIKFSTVAILFIIFDIEVMLIFPWAVQVRELGWPGFAAMLVFLGILMLGFLYEWKKGGLEWD
jgi:NADH-quinone oxidoreductase subunit A